VSTPGPRRGTVYLLIEPLEEGSNADGTPVVDGYWDSHPGPTDHGDLGPVPPGLDLEGAVQWAKQRATRVVVRNEEPTFELPVGQSLWAGDGPPPDGLSTLDI